MLCKTRKKASVFSYYRDITNTTPATLENTVAGVVYVGCISGVFLSLKNQVLFPVQSV